MKVNHELLPKAWPVLPTVVLLLPLMASAQDGAPAEPGPLSVPEWLEAWLHGTARGIEVVGVAIIVLGGLVATFHYLWQLLRTGRSAAVYHAYRASLGRAILLGLEFLVAADIIGTVAVEPTLESLSVLAGIVLIRTFLSFALEVEIQGRWPWQQAPTPQPDMSTPKA
ncbi:DUF1622 domain-containing protein [Geminicoccus harenae]|uniref:DUF1622 domain-containing protein n=1 Tax=Geminicoccus harenae TaxID=2498453 RepID=UPI001C97F593|nr:DUF1622 domain-containing protein [Geminicoccus harenae]